MIYLCNIPSPLGMLTSASDGESITGLWIDGQKYYASTLSKTDICEQKLPVFDRLEEWLICYFAGKEPSFMPPLAPQGSPFRQAVWNLLLKIPYGQVSTYKELARQVAAQIGRQHMSAQAVGGAVGHNPISILIPCHRIVGTNGSLTGYAGGIDKKIQLLQLEHIQTEQFFVPRQK